VIRAPYDNLGRVQDRIGLLVVAFWRERLERLDPAFRGDELLAWVRARCAEIAPDSPGRILRNLRAQQQINYRLISRARSLYWALPHEGPPPRGLPLAPSMEAPRAQA
jgi:hypothetical protein